MRRVRLTIECDDRLLGPIIADMSEKPHVTIYNVAVVSTQPPERNGRMQQKGGMTTAEVLDKVVNSHAKGFSAAIFRNAMAEAGLNPSGAYSALSMARKNGRITSQGERPNVIYKKEK